MGRRVIVADDSKTVQKVIRIILAPAGYEVECFDNGSDALMAVKNSPPSLVLADIGMQNMDGYELGLLIKNEPKLKNIPVVLMYGANYEINYQKFISSGAKDKILKPFDAKILNEIVRKNALKSIDSSNMGVINIDVSPVAAMNDESLIPQDWDMDSFTEPKIPDMKSPLIDVEESENLKSEFSNLDLENVDLEDESELSEEESDHLYKEFDLEEKHDGTIQFKEEEEKIENTIENTEKDMGLWNDKYYIETVPSNEDIIPELKIEMQDEDLVTENIVEEEINIPMPDISVSCSEKNDLSQISEPIIRKMLKELLPDIAERVIREELNKLLAED